MSAENYAGLPLPIHVFWHGVCGGGKRTKAQNKGTCPEPQKAR